MAPTQGDETMPITHLDERVPDVPVARAWSRRPWVSPAVFLGGVLCLFGGAAHNMPLLADFGLMLVVWGLLWMAVNLVRAAKAAPPYATMPVLQDAGTAYYPVSDPPYGPVRMLTRLGVLCSLVGVLWPFALGAALLCALVVCAYGSIGRGFALVCTTVLGAGLP